jgi:hypothetical protein
MRKTVAEHAQDYNRKGVLFPPHHPRTILHGGATQQHSQQQKQPHPPTTAQACPATVGKMSAPPPSRHNQQQVPSQSVQAPDVNSSSLNDMFKVVTTVFQQIMRELNGAESEEDRIVAITKIVLQLMKQETNDYIQCGQVNL